MLTPMEVDVGRVLLVHNKGFILAVTSINFLQVFPKMFIGVVDLSLFLGLNGQSAGNCDLYPEIGGFATFYSSSSLLGNHLRFEHSRFMQISMIKNIEQKLSLKKCMKIKTADL
jgi:hypothetical protein